MTELLDKIKDKDFDGTDFKFDEVTQKKYDAFQAQFEKSKNDYDELQRHANLNIHEFSKQVD